MTQDQPGAAAKTALRDQIAAARRRRGVAELTQTAAAMAEHLLATPEVRRAATVTAYVSVGSEPGTSRLLEGLMDRGTRVLLPITTREMDLDWAVYTGPRSLSPARFGLLEPITPRLGVDAVAQADVLLLPGTAVSLEGTRIGKGGGCYDRALARVPTDRWRCVLLFDDEVGRQVPADEHDQPVHAACSPAGITRLSAPRPTAPG